MGYSDRVIECMPIASRSGLGRRRRASPGRSGLHFRFSLPLLLPITILDCELLLGPKPPTPPYYPVLTFSRLRGNELLDVVFSCCLPCNGASWERVRRRSPREKSRAVQPGFPPSST